MHPYTVYGIETAANVRLALHYRNCMHPYTVYGIETKQIYRRERFNWQLHAPLYRLRY